ncbi:MAG: adenylate/guanylate cyclase domain-containing protein [Pseudomonadota bacterium]
MSLEAINEQLLRAIGVGIALLSEPDHDVLFANEKFSAWFGAPTSGARLRDIFPDLDNTEIRAALDDGRHFSAEVKVKPKRRTLVIAVDISRAHTDDGSILVVECQNITRMHELEAMIDSYAAMVERNTREIEREKERVERLLLNIMPKQVYEEYRTFGVVAPQLFPEVSVVMLDLVGFTEEVAKGETTAIIGELNEIFTAFDRIAEQFGCERIKTIGDAYLAVAGMPEPNPDHARSVANCAVRFVRYLERRSEGAGRKWRCRVGIATGPVVGSVVGVQKYVYDIFGPAVNLAARMQEAAEPMTVVADEYMRRDLAEDFTLTDLGPRDIRGLGEMRLIGVSTALGRERTRL